MLPLEFHLKGGLHWWRARACQPFNIRRIGYREFTISNIPVDFAARARAFSPSGLIILARPVGQMNSGTLTLWPRTVLEVSTFATFLMTLGRNHILLYIDWFMSLVQQSVAAVE